jgi:hypothetical protein
MAAKRDKNVGCRTGWSVNVSLYARSYTYTVYICMCVYNYIPTEHLSCPVKRSPLSQSLWPSISSVSQGGQRRLFTAQIQVQSRVASVIFMTEGAVLEQVFLQVPWFFLLVIFHHCSINLSSTVTMRQIVWLSVTCFRVFSFDVALDSARNRGTRGPTERSVPNLLNSGCSVWPIGEAP